MAAERNLVADQHHTAQRIRNSLLCKRGYTARHAAMQDDRTCGGTGPRDRQFCRPQARQHACIQGCTLWAADSFDSAGCSCAVGSGSRSARALRRRERLWHVDLGCGGCGVQHLLGRQDLAPLMQPAQLLLEVCDVAAQAELLRIARRTSAPGLHSVGQAASKHCSRLGSHRLATVRAMKLCWQFWSSVRALACCA